MSISATERLLFLAGLLVGGYRYLTGEWPIGIEIEQVEE